MSSEEDTTHYTGSDDANNELSADVTDGASSPNQTTAGIPALSSDEE